VHPDPTQSKPWRSVQVAFIDLGAGRVDALDYADSSLVLSDAAGLLNEHTAWPRDMD